MIDVNSEKDIKNLLEITGCFHDGFITQGHFKNDTLYLYFEGEWGYDWELCFSGNVEHGIDSFDPDDFDDPYWFHASIIFEDGYIYLVRDYARNKSEINDKWYVKAKKLKYKIIKNDT